MTLEITDRDEFTTKFTHLMVATDNLKKAGMAPPRELVEHMVEEFLDQFTMTTPAAAVPKSAGYLVVNSQTGYIPADFKGCVYQSEASAEAAIEDFFKYRDYGQTSDYRIVEATYFA